MLGSLTLKYGHAHTPTPRVAMFGRVIIESMQKIRFQLSMKMQRLVNVTRSQNVTASTEM